MSSDFLVVEPNKIIFIVKNTIPKRRIDSYSVLGTIVYFILGHQSVILNQHRRFGSFNRISLE